MRDNRLRRAVIFSKQEMVPIPKRRTPELTTKYQPTNLAKQPQTFEDLFTHIEEDNLPSVEGSELRVYLEGLEEDQGMEEYLEVMDIDEQPYNLTAGLKCNRNKNRYVDVLANEFTRVQLLTPAGHTRHSDYINANYIQGYRKKNEYIAAQGPLEKTGADFWSMVWSEKSRNIVMVTNLVEDHRVKCFKYWPSEGVLLAHSLGVIQQDEQIFTDYTIRTFTVTLKDNRYEESGECRHVTQFHFTGWPDHGVPENTGSMLEFVRRVRSAVLPSHGPLIVHCSAGVGRTGTFIAVDVMLQKLEKNEPLDIMNFVCQMRAQRASMVQTSLQYMFIYKTLAHAFAVKSGESDSGENREASESGEAGESSEAGETGETGEAGEECVGSKVDSQTQLSQLFQGVSERGGRLVSTTSFTSDDFMDMHIV